ncbi:hypothetical protein GCM10009850_009550 [Nonomuraea monospora]|uniref:Uncharacterized protein n=1 Tax=Nonomuraea monospora TaxID=568818 RepID=A0ABN3C829_9ACTN
MLDLIYLSRSKLSSFKIQRRRRWWNRLRPSRGFTVAVLGVEIGVGESARPAERQVEEPEEVVEELKKAGRGPHSPGVPELRPGQWISFSGRFNMHIPGDGKFESVVFFLQSGESAEENGIPTRILLHGSAHNVLGGRPDFGDQGSRIASSGGLFEEVATDMRLQSMVADMRAIEEAGAEPGGSEFGLAHRSHDWFEAAAWFVVEGLEGRVSPATATWMSGLARVTAVCAPLRGRPGPRLLIASPLHVHYSDPRAP